MTISSQAALTHLRTIKPGDGWSVKVEDGKGMRLLRRSVPLTDNHFHDIHYCPKLDLVVGVLTSDGKTCQVLVDESGKPTINVRVVSVSTYDPKNVAANVNFAKSRSAAASTPPARPNNQPNDNYGATADSILPNLTPEQNKELIKWALIFVSVLMVARILATTSLALVVLPLVYFYGLQTCPSQSSFDAKKELKRVLRGHHLPEDHPNKPKGWLEEMAARVSASVAAEIATFPGYELEMTSMAGAAWVAEVRVPTAKLQCYWVGAFGRWYYITSFEVKEQET